MTPDANRSSRPACPGLPDSDRDAIVPEAVNATDRETLRRAYAAFNARDIEGALAAMHPDVEWANGMDGGFVHGHREVREYWTRQWGVIDPHVEPKKLTLDAGRIVVDVHQIVRDPAGTVIADRMVQHVYELAEGLVRRMEIRAP